MIPNQKSSNVDDDSYSTSSVDDPCCHDDEQRRRNLASCVDPTVNEDQTQCGVGACQPACMQRFKTMTCFTISYSASAITTSALSIYIGSQITTIEKYFNFSSSTSGFLMSCNDLGYLSTSLLMSYVTRRVHIPLGLAFSTVVFGFSGLLCSLAYFITRDQVPQPPKDSDSYTTGADVTFTQICENTTLTLQDFCNEVSKKKKNVFDLTDNSRTASMGVIALGMFLQGMAKSPRQPFIGTYVDDNVPKTKTTLYIAIIMTYSIIGPAFAYMLGSVVTTIYVTLEDTNITPRDPRWMGAWWIGFVGFGSAGLASAVPLIFFPRYMTVRTKSRITFLQKLSFRIAEKTTYLNEFKSFLKSYFRLCLNPGFMCLVLATSINLLAISGVMSFMPKYLESQFSVTASKANVVLGAINAISAAIGTLIGGYYTSRLKLTPLTCLKLLIFSKLSVNILMFWGFFLGCDQPVIISGSKTYRNNPAYALCLGGCDCEEQTYFPVCGSDNQNYFSPCHAGCTSMNNSVFVNCSCIAPNTTQIATGGLCEPDCNNLQKYIAMSLLGAFVTTLAMMPSFLVTIRSVNDEDKPMAIGFGAFLGTLLGWFPGPVVFGLLVDTTCILRKFTCTAGAGGACSLYNIELFRFRLHVFLITLRGVAICLYIAVYLLAKYSKQTIFQSNVDYTLENKSPSTADLTEKEGKLIIEGYGAYKRSIM